MAVEQFKITRLKEFEENANLHGYCVESTAHIDIQENYSIGEPKSKVVEFINKKVAKKDNSENQQKSTKIEEIAKHLVEVDNPQLVINIHGYSTHKKASLSRNEHIFKHAVDRQLCHSKGVFIGYRWPSEELSLSFSTLQKTLAALPTALLGILITTLALMFIPVSLMFGKWTLLWAIISFSLGFLVWDLAEADGALPFFPNGVLLGIFSVALYIVLSPFSDGLLTNHNTGLLVIIAVLILFMVLWLVVNRLSKKRYIRHNTWFFSIICLTLFLVFAVAFERFEWTSEWVVTTLLFLLVSLCSIVFTLIMLRLSNYPRDRYRASNYGVMDLVEFIRQLEQQIKLEKPDELKLKIELSFIAHSLGSEVVTQTIRILTNVFDQDRQDLQINQYFKLERLVLVAPDIPVETILSEKANFLRTPLERFSETYIFSNEADLALRLASTAANYFSFPSRSRFRGYKLGNITAKHFDDNDRGKAKQKNNYGIINWNDEPINHLEIRASNIEYISLKEIARKQSFLTQQNKQQNSQLANNFTYFDCTDYTDYKENSKQVKPVLSYALKKPALNFIDYVCLLFASPFAKIDGHGDYFKGEFSQELIYGLAFLGFEEFLNKKYSNPTNILKSLEEDCQNKQIQTIISYIQKNCILNLQD